MMVLETNCISIDPCLGINEHGESVPKATWLHANSSVLRLNGTTHSIEKATREIRAHNYGNLEFARVPEGLIVKTCSPDYDIWRKYGSLQCDLETLLTITANDKTPSCPGSSRYSILDCLKSTQFDSTVEHLHWRPPTQIMHFGSLTWNDACAVQSDNIADVLCNISAEQYFITVPKAAAFGTSSMIQYDFIPGYGCLGIDTTSDTHVLSREAAPNRLVTCPQVENGVVKASDAYTCDFICDSGYVQQGNTCVSLCDTFATSCPPTFKHIGTCDAHGVQHYSCQACDPLPGHEILAWTPTTEMGLCNYAACDAGTYSSGHLCVACAINTITSTTAQSVCESCNSTYTGLYSAVEGGTVCTSCLGHSGSSVGNAQEVCTAGNEYVQDFDRLNVLFNLYTRDRDSVVLSTFIDSFCINGYACLPCEPGFYETERHCLACPFGFYQSNFGSTSCFKCNDGQNTTGIGSTKSEQCLCLPGFT